MMEEVEERIRGSYGDIYERLVAVKRKYGPDFSISTKTFNLKKGCNESIAKVC